MKRCFKCERELPLSEFYRHPRMADGHLGKCKECAKKDVRARVRVVRTERAAYERQRSQDPARRAAQAEYHRRSRLRHPDRYRANNAVNNAVRAGKLIKQPCEVCGCSRAEGHHPDYSRPLDVRWLCRRCHSRQHWPDPF